MMTDRRRRPVSAGTRRGATTRGLRPRIELLEGRQLLASNFAFDFGPAGSPVASGYVGVGAVAYSAAAGYGWQDPSTLGTRDRGGSSALTRDFAFGHKGTFLVDVPNGTYNVTVTMGDAAYLHDQVAIYAGSQKVASGLNTAVGQVTQTTFLAAVTSGQMSLTLSDEGGTDPNFAIDALQLAATSSPQFTATATGPSTAPVGSIATLQAGAAFGTAPYTYAWDLDGSGQYATPGQAVGDPIRDTLTYRASVRVEDATGAVATASTSVTGTGVPAVASLNAPTYAGKAGHGVTFQGSATSLASSSVAAGLTFLWNFGDGSPVASGNSLTTTTHVYGQVGAYTVQLTVQDVHGLVSAPVTATVNITSADVIDTGMDLIPDFGAHPTIVSVASGNWSSPGTWSGGRLPAAGDVVDIVGGTSVSYDMNNLATSYKTIEVQAGGALRFRADINTGLVVGNLEIMEGGTLEIGTPSHPIAPAVSASVLIADQALDTSVDPQEFGTGLIALGTVTICGAPKTPTFDLLASEPQAGDRTLKLATPAQGWRPGDQLVLPDTRSFTPGSAVSTSQVETVTLAGVSADGTTVTLSAPLQYGHLGARDGNGVLAFLPHVNNISRNVSFESQNPSGTRGHVMFTDHAAVDVRYAEFCNLGRTTNDPLDNTTIDANGNATHIGTNQVGRYAVHMHHLMGPMGLTSPYTFTFIGNMMGNDPGQPATKWGLDVHDSSYGLIQDNVVFNVAGAGIVTESGSETHNTFDHNSVVLVVGNGSPGDGREGAGFWFRGPDNYVTNDVTSDTPNSFGFEYFMNYLGKVTVAAYAGDDIMMDPGSGVIKDMNATPILSFAGNESYGVTWSGLSYYWLGTNFNTPTAAGTSTFKNYSAWGVTNYGITSYQSSNVTLDGLTLLNDPRQLVGSLAYTTGIVFSDYYTRNFTLINSNIQGFKAGITLPTLSDGVQAITSTYFRNVFDVVQGSPWNISYSVGWLPPRLTYLTSDLFDLRAPALAPSLTMTAINATYNAGVGSNIAQKDQLFVVNYNGVGGDNFQVFYEQQAAGFVMPQSILNPDGTYAFLGAPAANLTNAQDWAQYGVAVAGAVAPSAAKRRSGIAGALIAPTS